MPKVTMPFQNAPAVSIKKNVYAMASVDGAAAEITLYGDIYEQQPVNPWTGKPVEGQFILLNEFLDDLKQIEGCKSILIRMHSYGGDAGVSNVIHNRLRDLSRNGTKLFCIVDGVAMSGGSLIMCACDHVQVNPSSLIMVHKSWSFLFGGYNADELRDLATQSDAWDKMQSEIYQRKTGLSNAVIMHMMADTTFMTGREAVEKGLADELLDAEPTKIAASADGRSLFVFGRQVNITPGLFAPDDIPTVTPEASATDEDDKNTPVVTGNEEEENSMTIEEIRAQYPEVVAQVEAEARASVDNTEAINAAARAERDRIAGIDEVACLFDPALVHEAKYGEHPCTAAELALRAAKAAKAAGSKFLADAKTDADESGAATVPAAPAEDEPTTPDDSTPEAKMNEARAAVKAIFKKEDK